MSASGGPVPELVSALQRLDDRLQRALGAAHAAYGPQAASDPFRGLHIGPDDVGRLLARGPCAPLPLGQPDPPGSLVGPLPESSRLAWLARAFTLSPVDLDVLVVAVAPDLDRRYERLYAYLQDDVTRRRPSVDLVLNLLGSSVESRLERRAHFAPEAPLLAGRLVRLVPEAQAVEPTLLGHSVRVDEQILGFLLGHESLDPRLAAFCRMVTPGLSLEDVVLSRETRQALARLAAEARVDRRPRRLYLQGPVTAGAARVAEAVAAEAGMRLLAAELPRALAGGIGEFGELVSVLFREAWLHDAILYVEGVEALFAQDQVLPRRRFLRELADSGGGVLLGGEGTWTRDAVPGKTLGVLSIPLDAPSFQTRLALWRSEVRAAGLAVGDGHLAALADRFRLDPGRIAEAVESARARVRWQAGGSDPGAEATGPDLWLAARAQCTRDLAGLARRVTARNTWEDIVLPEDVVARLQEICRRVSHRRRVLGEWGFGRKLSLGTGVSALFSGPSGTGKTMAAEIVARELGLELYKIDLSQIVSKWIGETEKNLDRIFKAAEDASAILFFDEADALFGKRSEVRDSHDRYANVEIAYLLQKMEEYEGVAILATNLRANLDDAFIRRLAFVVHFPFPDEQSRRRIWQKVWPPEVPLESVDMASLARELPLSGGLIRNVAVAAAFLAAADGGVVTVDCLRRAVHREYQKLGKEGPPPPEGRGVANSTGRARGPVSA